MKNNEINNRLASGSDAIEQMLPHLAQLQNCPYVFNIDFGLKTLPTEAGILLIRGARQYGKSTWLEQQIYLTMQQFGAGSAYYLNGDYLANASALEQALENLIPAFRKDSPVKRIFIDEITSIPQWETVLKRMADQSLLANILIITTGSSATDLRRGGEKLPGRKGKLARHQYLFTPIDYGEFHRQCGAKLKEKTLIAYLLSGGSPIACNELASHGLIPEYVISLVRDWIEGDIAKSGRNRSSLINIVNTLFRFGVSPIGQAKLAREAGLANNTVAQGYMDILADLGCVIPAYAWDPQRQIAILRKPCKYHFINLLAAVAYHPAQLRHIDDFNLLSSKEQGIWLEWLVAQELQRRAAINGKEILAPLLFWQSKQQEIDFVLPPKHYVEVKKGQCFAPEFSWFSKQFPNKHLTLINPHEFKTDHVTATNLENFLLDKP